MKCMELRSTSQIRSFIFVQNFCFLCLARNRVQHDAHTIFLIYVVFHKKLQSKRILSSGAKNGIQTTWKIMYRNLNVHETNTQPLHSKKEHADIYLKKFHRHWFFRGTPHLRITFYITYFSCFSTCHSCTHYHNLKYTLLKRSSTTWTIEFHKK